MKKIKKNLQGLLRINYDLPDSADDYVHRIGRTGRAGSGGHAISFATPDQRKAIHSIERVIRKPFPVSKTPYFTAEEKVVLPSSTPFTSSFHTRETGRRPFQHQQKKFHGSSQSEQRKKFRYGNRHKK